MDDSSNGSSQVGAERGLRSLLHLRGLTPAQVSKDALAHADDRSVLLHFRSPSEAIARGLQLVQAHPGTRGSVVTTEQEPAAAAATAAAAADQAEPNQLLACLATREAARLHLSGELRFLDVGQMLGRGDHFLRLFLVAPAAPHATAAAPVYPDRLRFIGRSKELSDLHWYLDRSRTVIVRGGAGTGKSALLRQYMSEYEGTFRDGAMIVDLANVDDANLVAPTIMRALEVPKGEFDRGVHAIVSFLAQRQMLVMFDGIERWSYLVTPLLTQLTETCLDGAFVVATQKRIRIPRALTLALAGLDCPPDTVDPDMLCQYDAAALFVERAQQVEPRFAPDERNTLWIARLTRKLAGNPMAIEIAATKVATLSPRQILDRLDDSVALLKTPTANLSSSIAMAVGFAGEDARKLLTRMAILKGAHTASTLASLCATEDFPPSAVHRAFEEMVDASLLDASHIKGDEQFYYLPEPIRLYGLDQLSPAARAEQEAKRDKWVLSLCGDYLEKVNSADQLLWQDRLDAAYEDVKRTLDRLIKAGRGDEAVIVARACQRLWYERAYYLEGIGFFERIEKIPSLQKTASLLRIMNLRAVFLAAAGRAEQGRQIAVQVLRRVRQRKLAAMERIVLTNLGVIYQGTERRRKCRLYYRKGADKALAANDDTGALWSISNYIGFVEGSISDEELKYRRIAFEIFDRQPNPTALLTMETNWAERLWANDRLIEGRVAGIRALDLARRLDHPQPMRQAAHCVGKVMLGLGQYDTAAKIAGFCQRLEREIPEFNRPPEDPLMEGLLAVSHDKGAAWLATKTLEGSLMTVNDILELVKSTL